MNLSEKSVEKLRKDFLVLMRIAENADTTEDALQANSLLETFRENLQTFTYKRLVPQIKNEFIAARVRKNVWALCVGLSEMGYDRFRHEHDPQYREMYFNRYLKAREKWLRRVKTYARPAWAALLEAIGNTSNLTNHENSQIDVAGIPLVIQGYSDDPDKDRAIVHERMEELRIFQKRAREVAPILLKNKIPFILHLGKWDGGSGDAAHYDGATREIHLTRHLQMHRGGNLQLLAHELAHHVYATYLSGADKAFWDTAIKGDYGPVSLRDVLAVWPADRNDWLWIEGSAGDGLRKTDPTLYLQIQCACYPPTGDPWFESREELEAMIAKGTETIVLPSHPITRYATASPEESFCEAIGLLVAYGPRAVDRTVRDWLGMIVPGVKTATRLKSGSPVTIP